MTSTSRFGAKICGLSTDETRRRRRRPAARPIVGFVFFARSPRNLEPEAAARLAAPLRQGPMSGPWPSPSIPTTPWSTG
jgi:phosphoribosylanthranilate isomerase